MLVVVQVGGGDSFNIMLKHYKLIIYPARAQTKVQSNTNGLDQICVMSVEMKEATRYPATDKQGNRVQKSWQNLVAFH